MGVGPGQGFEALRLIFREFRPRGDTSQHNMLVTIIQPRWWCQGAHATRPFMDVLLDWEKLIIQYELASRQQITEGTKCATLSGYAPKSVRDMIAASAQETRHNYRLLRQAIQDFVLSVDPASFVPKTDGMTSQPPGGDVAAIGFDKKVCAVCGKPGHHESKCWHRDSSKGDRTKGDGKRGHKGDGKRGHKGDDKDQTQGGKGGKDLRNMECFYCKRKGHMKKDCRKYLEDKKNGLVQMIDVDSASAPEDDLWCMVCTDDIGPGRSDTRERFLLLDGGSDEHCATRAFAPEIPLEPTTTRLRDAQRTRIPLDGCKEVQFLIDDLFNAKARFQIGNFSKDLLSTGKVHDAGFDVIMSRKHGCFIGKGDLSIVTGNDYKKVCMERRGNTFGLRVRTQDPLQVLHGKVEPVQSIMVAESSPKPSAAASSSASGSAPVSGDVPEQDALQSPPVEKAFVAQSALGPDSRADLLRARLKELGEKVWGTKQILWTRLQKAEKRKEIEIAAAKAAEDHAERQALGKAPADVKGVPAPVAPSKAERERHELTHTPEEPWCEECVMGEGVEKPHEKTTSESSVPLVVFDYAFNAATGAEGEQPDKSLGTSLVMVNRETGFSHGNAMASKEADAHSVKEVNRLIKQLGFHKVEVRCDTENATVAIQNQLLDVRSKAGEATLITNGKTRDSKSMGLVESVIRWWRGKLKTLRFSVEHKYARKLTPNHVLWSWLARHAAWLNNRYRLRADGSTAFFAAYGHTYTGEVVPFSETVLFKAPASATRQKKGGRRQHKADSAWARGLWVGKSDNNDEHIVLTVEGKMQCRTVRRMEPSKRHDQTLFGSVIGLPWQDRLLAVRGQAKILTTPTPVPEIVEPESADSGQPSEAARAAGDDLPAVEFDTEEPDAAAADVAAAVPYRSLRQRVDEFSREGIVSVMAIAAELHEKLDYSCLAGLEELDHYNSSHFDGEDVARGKIKGLDLLDEFGVYEVHPSNAAFDKKKVDTKWEISMRAGELKCRLVGREFKFLEDRDDLFAPGSTAASCRVVDYLALKDDDDPSDPLVTFIGDCISAYYQTPELEEFYADPPPEWIIARREAGLDTDVVWKLCRQLPGSRAAGKQWIAYCSGKLTQDCGLERYEPLPQFFRQPSEDSRLVLELHMDDFHGVGKRSEVLAFLGNVRGVLKLKASDAIMSGRYEHLKRTRVKMEHGTLIKAHPKHARNIVSALNLENANSVKTPNLDEEPPMNSPALPVERHQLYRKCVGHGIYMGIDRYDCQRVLSMLGRDLSHPTEFSWKRLTKLARYLIGAEDVGIWLPRVDPSKWRKGAVTLAGFGDSDHAGCKASRKSMSSKVVFADCCQLFTQVRRQAIESISSGEAEFYSLTDLVLETKPLKDLFEWLGFKVIWECGTDSSAAKGMSLREGIGKVRHLDTRSLWTQRAVRELVLKIKKLQGKYNCADLRTKSHSSDEHERLMKMAGLVHGGGFDAPVVDVHVVDRAGRADKSNLKVAIQALLTMLSDDGDVS